MSDPGVIAMRYARALLIHAGKRDEYEAVSEACLRLLRALRSHPALSRILADPILGAQKKREVIAAAVGEMPSSFVDFVALVVDRGREGLLMGICIDYVKLYHEQERLTDVWVTTAVPVDKAHEQALASKFARLIGGRVTLNMRTDPALIGGYLARWNGYRLDASVRTQLQRIEKGLMR